MDIRNTFNKKGLIKDDEISVFLIRLCCMAKKKI